MRSLRTLRSQVAVAMTTLVTWCEIGAVVGARNMRFTDIGQKNRGNVSDGIISGRSLFPGPRVLPASLRLIDN